jgi:predicted negative regulator of RcsB-dependent stress response
MATYDLEEQEQLSQLKVWWDRYGNLVTATVVGVALVVVGWQGWNAYQRKQAAEAGAVYGALAEGLAAKDTAKVRQASGELLEKYGGTHYAALGALLSAKSSFNAGDLKTAKAQLGWVEENAATEELRDFGRLRLAYVLVEEKAYDAALAKLQPAPVSALAARFAELRGDILLLQDKPDQARAAFEQALKDMDAARLAEDIKTGAQAYRSILEAKLEGLGGKQ